ncbi:MAG: DNA polymerase III subunit delta' [Chloroflexota bacterium]|nr:DNA polymerase III subunit delta' [Dehalococcoidia bacterium]MDW8254715.1 DNA polymerase III subunit delta' [Chloroflexota bacterium]
MATSWGVVGQRAAVALLDRSLREGRLHHAYLLAGPPRVGKGTLALALAQAVNCAQAPPPCGECRSCRRVARGLHPDVVTLGLLADEKSESGRLRKNIGIAQVQELHAELALQPYEGRARVVIVDGAERLSTEASNALLKTLEEPPANAILILLANEPDRLLPTIRSRCQRLDLRLVPEAEIAAELARRGAEPAQAALLARLARGKIGWAIEALASADLLDARAERLDALLAALEEGTVERLERAGKLAARFSASREEVYETLDLWQSWLRDALVVASGGAADLLVNPDRQAEIEAAARACAPAALRTAIEALRRCRQQLEANVNARLALEAALLELPRLAGSVARYRLAGSVAPRSEASSS